MPAGGRRRQGMHGFNKWRRADYSELKSTETAVISIATAQSTQRQRVFAALVALILTAVAVAAAIHARTPAPAVTAFLPAFGTAVFLFDAITGYLLFTQFAQTRFLRHALLGAAFWFTALSVVAQVMTFPGAVTATGLFGAGSQTSVWLWVIWHAGFPLWILLYAWAEARSAVALTPAQARRVLLTLPIAVALLVAALVWTVTALHDYLPPLIQNANYRSLMTSGIGPAVLLINAVAVLAVAWVTRSRTIMQLWLLVALLTATLDVWVTLFAGSRFTIGWYAARINSVVSASLVLAVFLYEIHRLYAELAKVNSQLESLARLDALTGLANRRAFDERLEMEWNRHVREGAPLAVVMIDIDYFKSYNDTYGHPAGDTCLQRLSACVRAQCNRPADLVARYGGEELVIILPNTPLAGAQHVAERIRTAVAAMALTHAAVPQAPFVSVSVGVASVVPSGRGRAQTLVAQADRALYAAKRAGRNCVQVERDVDAIAEEAVG